MMIRSDFRRYLPWMILAVSILTGLIVFTGLLPAIRPLLVLIFYATCPGLAFTRLIRIKDTLTEVVLMVALSLVIDSLVAIALLYTGNWSYVTGLLIIIGISMLGALLSIPLSSRAERVEQADRRMANPLPLFDPMATTQLSKSAPPDFTAQPGLPPVDPLAMTQPVKPAQPDETQPSKHTPYRKDKPEQQP